MMNWAVDHRINHGRGARLRESALLLPALILLICVALTALLAETTGYTTIGAIAWGALFGMVLAYVVGLITRRVTLSRTAAHSWERHLFDILLNSIPDAIYFKDSESRFIRTSKAMLWKHAMNSEEELLGKTDFDIFSEQHARQAFEDEQKIIATGNPLIGVEEMETWADGRITWASTSKLPLRDQQGKIIGTFGISRDITERKNAEQALERRTEELAEANARLQEFAYIASHDLQEPLRMVASYVKLLEKRYRGQLDQEADEFIAYAVDGANRMQALIQGLLEYSRVGTEGKPLTPIALEHVLAHTLKNLEIPIHDSEALITHDALPIVMGDELQLEQLLQNLISNALKFKRADTPPCIHISACLEGDHCLISVQDNGIGFDMKYKDRIFAMFQRLHARSEYTGTGIGLAVCRRIVERHNGNIWAESVVGSGTTFYFTLTLAQGGSTND